MKVLFLYKTAEIEGEFWWDEENDVLDGYFLHPMTGNHCQEIEQCFYGWSEQNQEYQKDWDALVDRYYNSGLDWSEWVDNENDRVLVVDFEKNEIYYKKEEG
ncbi:hypothetical protein NrS5_36 [Nitratiruptor phage NrS-5]|uniref:hypothetical protein n=1 Tax=unclassified Nitratiruptor TaxID=2624044 RepID=UPI001914ED7D|nr:MULTISPECIES: hypothetical protein [unclassified Nitratiruptor]BCD61740.1 hypothetical protein NitYY0813_C0600 [Nitratiruptor sp. YY08-13]BCD65675.1 hypothetical protein NitYY0826_C0602 [Nitratiruptor sp. YY08-26]BCD83218.1 hypothetical protein NrS4_36 [Nitratiruptor phage NrS-4]BCD83277.1 hypothetical protein NrS5_36 [Nitratiruptor phage NrS-5]